MFSQKDLKRSRTTIIVQSLLEYMVSLLVTGTFLSAILKNIGVSDATSGIVSSFVSLMCVVQIFSGFVVRQNRSTKKQMLLLTMLAQGLFASLYLIPYLPIAQEGKVVVFIVVDLAAYALNSLGAPAKSRWHMRFITPGERGSFSAKNEMVSLIGGMLYTLLMGALVDHYKAIDKAEQGFVVCGILLFVVAILNLVCVFLCADEDRSALSAKPMRLQDGITLISRNPALKHLLVMDLLNKIGLYLTTPFYGTYLIGELGFSLTFTAVLSAIYSITRTLVSPYIGRQNDKRGWCYGLLLGSLLIAAGLGMNVFLTPKTRYFYIGYYVLYAIANAGLNSASAYITFDFVPVREYALALGIRNAISGVLGFLITLLGSAIVRKMQAGGNLLLGKTVYAQQVLSFAGMLAMLGMAAYVRFVIQKIPKISQEEET